MFKLPETTQKQYLNFLHKQNVSKTYINFYLKWLRYYLDFCQKYKHDALNNQSLGAFLSSLQLRPVSYRAGKSTRNSLPSKPVFRAILR